MGTRVRSESDVPRRLAFLLFVIGAVFAVDAFFGLSLAARFWPLLITVVSIGFIGISLRGPGRQPWLLVVGVYTGCFSILALVCNGISWGLLSRLWPLFIAFIGVTFIALYLYCHRSRFYLFAGLLLVAVCGAFSAVLATGSSHWWVIFIAAGLSIRVAEKVR